MYIRYVKKGPRKYAMYKGDEFLSEGTAKEICEDMGISIKTFQYYRSSAYKERLKKRKNKNSRIIVRIED